MFVINKQGGCFGGTMNFLLGIYKWLNKEVLKDVHNYLSFKRFCCFGGRVRGIGDFESRRNGKGKRKTEDKEGKRKTEDGR